MSDLRGRVSDLRGRMSDLRGRVSDFTYSDNASFSGDGKVENT